MGASKASVRRIFQLQGLLIGLIGSALGAAGGWLFCVLLLTLTRRGDGTAALPVDPALGEYGTAILLATLAGTVAAILPARSAARVDPVEVIQQ
jgi:lipoprotein-releasing system permease protein